MVEVVPLHAACGSGLGIGLLLASWLSLAKRLGIPKSPSRTPLLRLVFAPAGRP
jgi:hypothetical protein